MLIVDALVRVLAVVASAAKVSARFAGRYRFLGSGRKQGAHRVYLRAGGVTYEAIVGDHDITILGNSEFLRTIACNDPGEGIMHACNGKVTLSVSCGGTHVINYDVRDNTGAGDKVCDQAFHHDGTPTHVVDTTCTSEGSHIISSETRDGWSESGLHLDKDDGACTTEGGSRPGVICGEYVPTINSQDTAAASVRGGKFTVITSYGGAATAVRQTTIVDATGGCIGETEVSVVESSTLGHLAIATTSGDDGCLSFRQEGDNLACANIQVDASGAPTISDGVVVATGVAGASEISARPGSGNTTDVVVNNGNGTGTRLTFDDSCTIQSTEALSPWSANSDKQFRGGVPISDILGVTSASTAGTTPTTSSMDAPSSTAPTTEYTTSTVGTSAASGRATTVQEPTTSRAQSASASATSSTAGASTSSRAPATSEEGPQDSTHMQTAAGGGALVTVSAIGPLAFFGVLGIVIFAFYRYKKRKGKAMEGLELESTCSNGTEELGREEGRGPAELEAGSSSPQVQEMELGEAATSQSCAMVDSGYYSGTITGDSKSVPKAAKSTNAKSARGNRSKGRQNCGNKAFVKLPGGGVIEITTRDGDTTATDGGENTLWSRSSHRKKRNTAKTSETPGPSCRDDESPPPPVKTDAGGTCAIGSPSVVGGQSWGPARTLQQPPEYDEEDQKTRMLFKQRLASAGMGWDDGDHSPEQRAENLMKGLHPQVMQHSEGDGSSHTDPNGTVSAPTPLVDESNASNDHHRYKGKGQLTNVC